MRRMTRFMAAVTAMSVLVMGSTMVAEARGNGHHGAGNGCGNGGGYMQEYCPNPDGPGHRADCPNPDGPGNRADCPYPDCPGDGVNCPNPDCPVQGDGVSGQACITGQPTVDKQAHVAKKSASGVKTKTPKVKHTCPNGTCAGANARR